LISSDALEGDVNQWDDYFWTDVPARALNIELTRKLKEESTEELVELFPEWRQNPMSFEEHWNVELRTMAQEYLRLYVSKIQQLANGNFDAALFSPIDSNIVEMLARDFDEGISLSERFNTIGSFFESKYYAEVPCEHISSGLMTVLRDSVKRGQFQNARKAKDQMKGIFFDHEAISAYAPYCDAFFVDGGMLEMVRHSKLDLEKRFPTRFFAKSNWSELLTYLELIRSEKSEELSRAIQLVYPNSPKRAKA